MENDLNKSISVCSGEKEIDFFSLASPTAQQVFDHVVRGVVAQGGPSLNRRGYCQYHGLDGRKCAAGQAIADSEYSEIMEGKNVAGIMLPARLLPHIALLVSLQAAHDNNKRAEDFIGAFKASASRVAATLSLNADAAHEKQTQSSLPQ